MSAHLHVQTAQWNNRRSRLQDWTEQKGLDKGRNNLQKYEQMYVFNITKTSKNYLNPQILLQNNTYTNYTNNKTKHVLHIRRKDGELSHI
jgi:hypothetical protein